MELQKEKKKKGVQFEHVEEDDMDKDDYDLGPGSCKFRKESLNGLFWYRNWAKWNIVGTDDSEKRDQKDAATYPNWNLDRSSQVWEAKRHQNTEGDGSRPRELLGRDELL